MAASFKTPVCCLFKDGLVWRELLIVAELGPKQWFCINADWAFVEDHSLALAEAISCGAPVFFGDPEKMRFEDEQAQLGDLDCHWLRCSANGMPMPDLLSDDPSKYHFRSMFRATVQASDLPRGEGKGVLSSFVVQKMAQHGQKVQEMMLSPKDFPLEALDLWEKLYLCMSRALRLMSQHAEHRPPSGQIRGFGRGRGFGGYPLEQPQAVSVPQDSGEDAQSSDSAAEDEDEEKSEKPQETGREAEAKLAQQKKHRRQVERVEVLRTLQRLLESCWPLLEDGQRREILSFAVENISLGLQQIFQDAAEEHRDDEIQSLGMGRFLAQELSEMQMGLASQQRSVSWPPSVCNMVLTAFETQIGLFRRTSQSYHHFGNFVSMSSAPPELSYPVTSPSAGQCQRLKQWKKVIRKLRKGDEGDGTGTGSRGAAAVLGTWGCLPTAAQYVSLSFLFDWTGFNSSSVVCRHFWKLCHQAASWEGIQLVAMGVDQQGCGLLDNNARLAFRSDSKICMNHWMVRYLRLGMAMETSKRPILLGPNTKQLQRLAKAFELRGFAWPWSFPQHELDRLASAKAPAKRKSRKLPAPWMAEMASEGAFDAQQEVLLTFPESEEVLHLRVCSERTILTRSHASLGGAWFEAAYAEVAWIFDPQALASVDLLSLALISNGLAHSRSKGQDTLRLFLRGHGAKASPHALLASAPAAAPLVQQEMRQEPVLGPGVYVSAETNDRSLDDVGEYEDDEVVSDAINDPMGFFGAAGKSTLQSPWQLPSPSLTSLQSGDRWGLALVKVMGGFDADRYTMGRMVGLLVLLNQKVIGCCWCHGVNGFKSQAAFLEVQAMGGSHVGLAAQRLAEQPPLKEWLKALETAPVLRAQFRAA